MQQQTMFIEHLGMVELYFGMGVKILTGLVLGGLIGYDREQKMKSAGIKTNIMICIGATLYTAISIVAPQQTGQHFDMMRIPAQIVSGVGFLGAGAIMGRGNGNIVGLTTAATIWVVAAIGVTIGLGYPLIATIFTITILVVLRLLGPLYQGLESTKQFKYFHVEILCSGDIKNFVKEIVFNVTDRMDELKEEVVDEEANRRHLDFYVFLHPKKMRIMAHELNDIVQVEKVHFHQLDTRPSRNNFREEEHD